MNIQDSPFHSIKAQSASVKKNNQNLQTSSPSNNNLDKSNNFSFWDWFRGLVNPLQNLPLISGIYSSINSDDNTSDRDLVQNSLGGFMYGGPIGAIVGFGNWVFNKVFDKTPTEFALDATGISNLWKNDEEDLEKKKVVNYDNKNLNLSNKSNNETMAWWEKGKINSNLSKNLSIKTLENKPTEDFSTKLVSENSDNKKLSATNQKLSLSKLRYEDEYINLENKKLISVSKNIPTSEEKIVELTPLKKKVNYPSKLSNKMVRKENSENSNEFREINFDYPIWKPEDLKEKLTIQSNKNAMKNRYLKNQPDEIGSSLNLKL